MTIWVWATSEESALDLVYSKLSSYATLEDARSVIDQLPYHYKLYTIKVKALEESE
jgi:hypothetical protein